MSDLLWQHIKTLPAFRALLRAVEARFYPLVDLPDPILDLGCGDGNFAELTFPGRTLTAGLDPWWNPLRKAVKAGVYHTAVQGFGDNMPFPDEHFASAFSNSVLEHIPNIQPVLNETSRVMQTGGRFLITMPNHRFTECLAGAQFFEQLGSDGLADQYRRLFNKISRHQHTQPVEWWADKLATAGFEIERWQYYFSEGALHALEVGHAQGVPSAVSHALTGHWILAPSEQNLALTDQWVRPFFEEEADENGTYVLIIARKVRTGPIEQRLPPAQPFTLAELNAAQPTAVSPLAESWQPTAQPIPTPPTQPANKPEPVTPTAPNPPPAPPRAPQTLTSIALAIALALIFVPALVGQISLSTGVGTWGTGVAWYAVSLLALLGLTLYRYGWQWPRRTSTPVSPAPADSPAAPPPTQTKSGMRRLSRPWLIVPALFLSLGANVLGGSVGLVAWLTSLGMVLVALWPLAPGTKWPFRASKTTWLTAVLFFVTSTAVRLFWLDSHPFLLSGTEANIGLEVRQIIAGRWPSPFSTAFLTNPALPLYLYALPLRFLDGTVWGLRLLSPLMGGLTVTAVYLFGHKLFGRGVGLVAATLLVGLHPHLHYSRLALTNIWDPLLALLTLGFVAVAWSTRQRAAWLLSGLGMGLSFYLYTAGHLLPWMILLLLGWAVLFDRKSLRENLRGLGAAGITAVVAALPIWLTYNATPSLFWDRWRQFSLFDTNWLATQGDNTAVLWTKFGEAALAFQAVPDVSIYYNPGQSLLGFWVAVAFTLGLGMAVWHGRELRYAVLLIWVGVVVFFAGFLLIQTPSSHRYLIALPAVVLLAALPVVGLVNLVWQTWRAHNEDTAVLFQPLYPALLVLIALAMIGPDMLFYFRDYRQFPGMGDPNTEVAHVMGNLLQDVEGDTAVYFLGAPIMFADFPTIGYLAPQFQRNFNLFDVPDTAENWTWPTPAPGQQLLFIVHPARFNEVAALESQYPGGAMTQPSGYFAAPLFLTYTTPPPE